VTEGGRSTPEERELKFRVCVGRVGWLELRDGSCEGELLRSGVGEEPREWGIWAGDTGDGRPVVEVKREWGDDGEVGSVALKLVGSSTAAEAPWTS